MSQTDTILKPMIFREYIGVKSYPDNLTAFPVEIINSKIPEFYFILGFATEDYDKDRRGTGFFKRTWNNDFFSAEKIKTLKETYENVNVVISIGGRGEDKPFNPADKDLWSNNAIKSITKVLNEYKDGCGCNDLIDGIDINYENIFAATDIEFARCVGKVIKKLRQVFLFNVVSIAPSDRNSSGYKTLYERYGDYIDLVDYQFYKQTVLDKDEFVKLYLQLTKDYDAYKLLAGFSTDPYDSGKISEEVFIEGCTDLINRSLLSGVSIWNGNDSAVLKSNHDTSFLFEKKMQNLLTKSD